jgi:hypothetical protein
MGSQRGSSKKDRPESSRIAADSDVAQLVPDLEPDFCAQ